MVMVVIPGSGPHDPGTRDLVNTVRNNAPALQQSTTSHASVTAAAAVQTDVSDRARLVSGSSARWSPRG